MPSITVMCMPFTRPFSRLTSRTPLAVNRDTPGSEVGGDTEGAELPRMTVSAAHQPARTVRLEPVAIDTDLRSLAGVGAGGGEEHRD
jgi:hypothetical protein